MTNQLPLGLHLKGALVLHKEGKITKEHLFIRYTVLDFRELALEKNIENGFKKKKEALYIELLELI